MKKTSEIIAELQRFVNKYGDLPFLLEDNEFRDRFGKVSVDLDDTKSFIEIIFSDDWETLDINNN